MKLQEDGTLARDPGTGPDSAGQSGDTQGLSDVETSSESVLELIEDGQSFEAESVEGIENAPHADASEIHIRQRPEDDVPLEYQEQDRDDL